MENADAQNTIKVVLEGRQVEAAHRETVLSVARRFGLHIPTLCHCDALEPAAACRVCLVEVRQGDWRKVVTACNYPVWDGVEIHTSTPEILELRKLSVEALLARCPEVPAIRSLAAKLGVGEPRFPKGKDTCILCGLCTRVCDTYATSAISMLGRGANKTVATLGGAPAEACVGCAACADICPTGHIKIKKEPGSLTVWDKTTAIATCAVETDRCRGCGICEESCPFRVPRVVLHRDGSAQAVIDVAACRGCGVCLAACPTGAIVQPRGCVVPSRVEVGSDGGRALVVACGRSGFGQPHAPALPERVELLRVPCAGSASASLIAGALARGYDGVLVLGRHQETCRLSGAEQHPRRTARAMADYAALLGLGQGRVRFVEPDPGSEGPARAVKEFLAHLSRTPLRARYDKPVENLDDALDATTWLSARPELVLDAEGWLESCGFVRPQPGQPALLAGAVPFLDLLIGDSLRPWNLVDVLRDGLLALSALGIEAGVAVHGLRAKEEAVAASLPRSHSYSQCRPCAERASRGGAVVHSLTELLAEKAGALGLAQSYEAVAVPGGDAALEAVARAVASRIAPVEPAPPLSLRFCISAQERSALRERLGEAHGAMARQLLVAGPLELVQHLLERRQGSWRTTHCEPVLPATLVSRALRARERGSAA
ncbi:MAG: 4Fe-4S binding protein [Myxococcota bacterium]|jgi:NAD-dependent dihydropyrimidine dehydrogenase PreA subunit/coenzyme F420-reducing hydrogenase delta subunit|nr:4Fe-4S binding protein [Myxococcota bacterium]